MADMLVKLYDLNMTDRSAELEQQGISVKRALALDRHLITAFVRDRFSEISPGWVGECELTLSRQPPTCYIAVHNRSVIGFCCWDSTARGMLGPLGVHPDWRGRGIAGQLIRASLLSMREAGYAYAVIGWVSSEAFYTRLCGAVTIPDSHPGVYSRMVGL